MKLRYQHFFNALPILVGKIVGDLIGWLAMIFQKEKEKENLKYI